MPSTSSGRIVKTSKSKRGTAHQKNHRWESFTAKVAKLNSLDPLRRVRRHDLDTEDLETTTSYFKNSLERWQELNMSGGFVEFTYEVTPLCDSLPQILHFEDKIMDLLVSHLELKERESVEPLLSLMTDFAHDLGTRFEKHYARALAVVTVIAGTPQDVEVIEWSFTCLAFMFKYLSKLLVADLRPTYNLMAPLLGKQRQQPHIARFAAEAMSFLIKKAGAPAVREKALPTIVAYAKADLLETHGTREYGLYYHGIMTMFAEAVKGNGLAIHTSGPAIIGSLFSQLDDEASQSGENSPWEDVICGVLTSSVHHASSETFKEILAVVQERSMVTIFKFGNEPDMFSFQSMMVSARAIGVVAGVRKGSRIEDWSTLLKAMAKILETISKFATSSQFSNKSQLWNSVVLSVGILLQYAPMDAIIPFIAGYLDVLTKDPLARWFLMFCSYLAQMDLERFKSTVLPYFQRFIVAHWSDADNADALCILIPSMVSSGALLGPYGKSSFGLPQSWQDQIVSKFERLEISPFPEKASPKTYESGAQIWHDQCLPKYQALLEILECSAVHPSTNARVAEILLRKLKLALRPSSALATDEAHFIVGRGFNAFSRMSKAAGHTDMSLAPLLRAAAPRYCRLPNFLEAMLAYEISLSEKASISTPSRKEILTESQWSIGGDDGVDLLLGSLVENLATNSHDLRLLSLQLLSHFHKVCNGAHSEVLATMLLIEQTPLDLQNARTASMHIRKLASVYRNNVSDPVLSKVIPFFCFGMLTVKFAQVWEDTSAALAQIAESKIGEEMIAELAFHWLETPSLIWDGSPKSVEPPRAGGLTDFECSNLMRLAGVAVEVESEIINSQKLMLKKFKTAQDLVESHPPVARTQALLVLSSIPQIAERRSRQLVPMFLSWARHEIDLSDKSVSDPAPATSDWTRKDQKAQLDLFGKFGNPKVLFKSAEVHSALLILLTNGDIEIQKSAIKALFTWKSPAIKPYEENLLNLLDEARFKDEITILLQGETQIQPHHRIELMQVLLRLLYGRTISRKGASSGRQGMENTRQTVLRNLSTEDTGLFLDIALGDLKDIKVVVDGTAVTDVFDVLHLSVRKQVGFVNMIEDILKELGTRVIPFTHDLISAILYCAVYASRQLKNLVDANEDEDETVSQLSMLKVIRQASLKCLILLFTNDDKFDWAPFIGLILEELVSPRLDKLPIETAQSVSGVLQLLSTWSASPRAVLFLGEDKSILPKIAECIAPPKSKDAVKLFALSIIRNVVKVARGDTVESENVAIQVKEGLLVDNMDNILLRIGGVLRSHQDLSKELLEACVETVSELAPFVSSSSQAHNLVDISVFLLDQPTRRVNPKTKSGLLLVLEHFVPLYDLQEDPILKDKVYNTVTSLFGFFKDRASREVLSRVLMVYSRNDVILAEVATVCADLNSYIEGRLDEPDYNRRLKAFNVVSKTRDGSLSAHQWRPLLYNMLYYIRHDEEFGILSSNSTDGICKFLDTASEASQGNDSTIFQLMISSIVVPALFAGAREPSEVIRREYLKVMAHVVRTFPDWSDVSDMHGLLGGDDELESSFFNNILAAGKGRQSGALTQLSATAGNGDLSSRNVSHFFIPIVEHFIFDRAEGNDAHNLAAEATTAVGVLAESLEWSQYRALLRRFTGYIIAKPDLEKQIIRLLGKVIDALATAADGSRSPDYMKSDDLQIKELEQPASKSKSKLSATLPNEKKFVEDLTTNVLPPLIEYLHDKDESTVSLRVPVAIIIVRLLKLLPQEQLTERLPAVLTDICHILRSKAQEARDMTRDTLTKICVLLGPSCFGFVLKELRGALARGYQLHVLSYTMHSILVATTPEYSPGDLDYCLPSIVAIIMDDIFGATGQEKDAEEYISKMKEVKSSKSHDSMELIAQTATLSRLTDLVRPIQVLLKEKLNLRMVRKIDELLNRISSGLLKNSAAQSRDSLVFCYEVIQDVYNSNKPQVKAKENYRLKRYLVQKGASKSGSRGSTTIYTHKLIRFAFDVLRSVLKKYDNLRTPANLAGFIPIIGDSVVQAEEEVKISAFRLLTTIVKVPLKVANDGVNLYKIAAIEATKGIAASSSTSSDISQAALKLLSVVLRDRHDVIIKDSSVDDLLSRLKEDMTDPDRRHVTFNFLRAVLDSKVESATVYDTLDYVGSVMVTNDDKDTRDLARGAYFQFLREYPQKKSRWSKQLGFIVANLQYEREGGRLSILEVIHLLLSKSSIEFVQEVSATCFVPLIFVLVNDESEKCRTAAGELIKEIFKKADKERLQSFLGLLRSWVKQVDNPSVLRLALQSFGFYYQVLETPEDSDLVHLQEVILGTLDSAKDDDSDWELIYTALQLTSNLLEKFPTVLLATSTADLWTAIGRCLSYPHAWVKLSSARLMGSYYADFARVNIADGLKTLPLEGSQGLNLTAECIRDLIRRTASMFKTPGLTELLANEIVKDLVFLGRCAGASELKWTKPQQADGAASDDEDEVAREDPTNNKTALGYLFGRLSFILRRESSPPRAPILIPKTAALQLLHILCSKLDAPTLSSSLMIILLPLQNLTDRSIPAPYSTDDLFKSGYDDLKSNSQELMTILQNKCGTADYTSQLLKVREGVKDRRNQRSTKRKIEAVTAPEKFGRDKQKKVERKKERRKEKGMEHRDQRHGY